MKYKKDFYRYHLCYEKLKVQNVMEFTTPEGIKDKFKGGVESDIKITFVFFSIKLMLLVSFKVS